MLTLWLDSYTLEFTDRVANRSLAALDGADTRAVFHRLDQERCKTQKAYTKPGFKFCYKGMRWSVPKDRLKELRMKCDHARDGGQAEFKLGVRVLQVKDITVSRLTPDHAEEEGPV